MLRYDVPQRKEGHSVWIELSTFEELPEQHRKKTRPTMAQSMARKSSLEIEVSYGVVTRELLYADLLKAFPDLDPEITYITVHHKTDRPYQWPPIK